MPNGPHMRQRAHLLAWWTDLQNEVNKRRHVHVLSDSEIVAHVRGLSAIDSDTTHDTPKKKEHKTDITKPSVNQWVKAGAGIVAVIAAYSLWLHLRKKKKIKRNVSRVRM